MKRHTVFMDWKAQHNKDVSSSQIDIQVYYNSYKTLARFFFCRYRQDYYKISVERQKNWISYI